MKAKILNCKGGGALQHGRVIMNCSRLFYSLQRTGERSRAPNTKQVQKEGRDTDYADQIVERCLHKVYYHCAPQVCISSLTKKTKHIFEANA